jgi:hypothetical protein
LPMASRKICCGPTISSKHPANWWGAIQKEGIVNFHNTRVLVGWKSPHHHRCKTSVSIYVIFACESRHINSYDQSFFLTD